jgi:Rps23 Pro-64 3,4-dihydroxylase Tpa1-like proline 4-hydroxylase
LFIGKIEAAGDARQMLAQLIASRLAAAADGLSAQWQVPGRISTAYVDGLMPDAVARAVRAAFPAPEVRKRKRLFGDSPLGAEPAESADPMLVEAVHAFRHPAVVAQLARITGLAALEPDCASHFAAISAMGEGDRRQPHCDDGHDPERRRTRVLTLEWHVSPGWDEPHGGNLQLWDKGPGGLPRTITGHFNRLVLIGADATAWHSVNAVREADVRCCVANAYFLPGGVDRG